ncbi:MAG: ribosome small subunit-dependent GTPase A [Firmicutes bacterium]|nr:ribosome small subunit-dependent GTPase A [Bacillota bacterium]
MNLLNQYGVTERFLAQATMFPDYIPARVVAQYRGKYKIVTEQNEMLAEISGKLRYDTDELAMYPAVGDYVMIDAVGDTAVIHHVLTRKSLFVRKAVGMSGQAQPIAANVDIAFLCMSLNQNYSLNRMERYLSIAWDSGAKPVVVLTKSDLCDNLDSAVEQIDTISFYSDIITVSMYDEDLCEKFLPYFRENQTCAFIGSSGVGKSTIINELLGESVITTQEIGKGDKGRHTTTGREMFPCPLGGVVIDTPGMREMGAESADLSKTFADISELAQQCQFRNCTHTNEPGCAVLKAVENGELDMRRLESYRKLEQEASYDGLSSKEIEIKKSERMFKEVGGMKNVRRYARDHNKRK